MHSIKKGPIAEINMIPFIDICLLLLIIFMVMTPFLMQSKIKVSLPESSSSSKSSDSDKMITVQILNSGAIIIDDKKTKFSQLKKELILRLSKSRKKSILVQADKNVSIQKVVTALDIAKDLGAGKIGIGVIQKSEKK
ncbi:MAG: biopolymer transporter ExbD [Elusimicrobia bacterium]|nr:biopolymer transporter ExbD [Elusimicrobiota bacterium]